MTKFNIKSKFKNTLSLFLVMILFSINTLQVNAQVQNVELEGGYRHPSTGTIEDSGGEASFALGQSMVDKMVVPQATYNPNSEYGSIIEFQMKMMDSISQVTLEVQEPGSDFTQVKHGQKSIDSTTAQFQVPVNNPNAVIKATCFVKPMGRSVVFFIYPKGEVANTATGNSNNNTDTSNNLGLIIGGPGITDKNQEDTSTAVTDKDNNQNAKPGYVIDESVWITLAMLIFSIIVFIGAFVVIVCIIVRKLSGKSSSKKNINRKMFDISEDEKYIHDEMDLDFDLVWENDDNENE